jgi:hypothetical protein
LLLMPFPAGFLTASTLQRSRCASGRQPPTCARMAFSARLTLACSSGLSSKATCLRGRRHVWVSRRIVTRPECACLSGHASGGRSAIQTDPLPTVRVHRKCDPRDFFSESRIASCAAIWVPAVQAARQHVFRERHTSVGRSAVDLRELRGLTPDMDSLVGGVGLFRAPFFSSRCYHAGVHIRRHSATHSQLQELGLTGSVQMHKGSRNGGHHGFMRVQRPLAHAGSGAP